MGSVASLRHQIGFPSGRDQPVLTFGHEPPGASVVGIDFSPAMLAQSHRRIGRSLTAVELKEMDVIRLDFSTNSFDGAVATFLFCVLPDELQVVLR
jgi:ubiquinone/menaquinone biosynthesis C-methylase UbiE